MINSGLKFLRAAEEYQTKIPDSLDRDLSHSTTGHIAGRQGNLLTKDFNLLSHNHFQNFFNWILSILGLGPNANMEEVVTALEDAFSERNISVIKSKFSSELLPDDIDAVTNNKLEKAVDVIDDLKERVLGSSKRTEEDKGAIAARLDAVKAKLQDLQKQYGDFVEVPPPSREPTPEIHAQLNFPSPQEFDAILKAAKQRRKPLSQPQKERRGILSETSPLLHHFQAPPSLQPRGRHALPATTTLTFPTADEFADRLERMNGIYVARDIICTSN